jgi:preprotein translocase subunit Sec61beta
MAENKMQMPGVFGGLMRYDSEYKSRLMITPGQVMGFVVLVLAFVIALKLVFPIVG